MPVEIELVCFKEQHLNGYTTRSGQPFNTTVCVYVFMCVSPCIYAAIITTEEEAINFRVRENVKRVRKGTWQRLEGEKW